MNKMVESMGEIEPQSHEDTKVLEPVLRFSEFNDSWAESPLSQIANIRTGPFGSVLHQHDYVEKGTPIITVEHLGEIGIVHNNLPLVSDEDKTRLKSYILKSGDLVFSRVGSVDRCSLVGKLENGWMFSGRLLRIRTNEEFLKSAFLNFYFKLEINKYRIRSVAVGQTMPSLNTAILNSFKVRFSSIKEQQKIADFLSSVDKKIEQLTEKHRLLTEYKKGVMQQIFTQQIRFKDNQGNDYPEWEEKKLGQFGSIVGGGTPETSQSSYWQGDIQWFTPTEIKQKYMSKSIRTISEEGLKKSSAKLLPVGALLLTTRATIADLSIATKECSTNQGFQSIIVNDQNDNEFLYYWILNNRKQFIRKASGSTFPEISKKEIEKMEGVFPQKEEQQRIANFLTEIDQKIDQAWSTLEQTKAFKKGLLQKMFV